MTNGSLLLLAVGSGPVAAFLASLVGEAAQVDPAAIVGGSGVGVAGWLAATVWSAYRRWSKLADLQAQVHEATLRSMADDQRHRSKEVDHWVRVESFNKSAERSLDAIYDELRSQRYPTGPHTPVTGIPIPSR